MNPNKNPKCKELAERCDYELIKIAKECNEGYVLYKVATRCDKCAQYLVSGLLMIGVNANATYKKRPILRWALEMADSEPLHAVPIAWYLVIYGADPNTRDSKGNTLLKYGADPHIRDKDGKTPFDYTNDTIAKI